MGPATGFLGIDAGSTTVKVVLMRENGSLCEALYQRHGKDVQGTLLCMLERLSQGFSRCCVQTAATGSASPAVARQLAIPSVQERDAIACALSILAPQTDVAIEIGGRDAKVLYVAEGLFLRLNEPCAGGIGAFIDQMAERLHTNAKGMELLAAAGKKSVSLSARCTLPDQNNLIPHRDTGVSSRDMAASVFQSVVDQIIGGLACGPTIRGNVALLGGPLHFLPHLRERLAVSLGLAPGNVVCIPEAQYTGALGTALCLVEQQKAQNLASEPVPLEVLVQRLGKKSETLGLAQRKLSPLFASREEYRRFVDEHRPALTEKGELSLARGPLFLGVDLGASVAKMVLVDRDGCVLHAWCSKAFETPLTSLVSQHARLPLPAGSWIRACAATEGGVGRVRAALGETAITAVREDDALLRAVCTLVPETSPVIDAGGKEMRYLVVRGGRVDGLALNSACPADFCGFFEPLVEGLALSRDELVARALFACHPVDFGDRCTELTHEKVREALKGGADRGDVAAGIVYAFARNTLGRMESPFRPWESYGELGKVEEAYKKAGLTSDEAKEITSAFSDRMPKPKPDLKEYFKDKYGEVTEDYRKGIGSFTDDALQKEITDSGLDKDPVFVSIMARVGKETGGSVFTPPKNTEEKTDYALELVKNAMGRGK